MIPDSTGTYFGELEFLGLSDERSNDIKAKVYCELSALHPKDVEDIIKQSAQLQERLHKYVELKTRLATLAYATKQRTKQPTKQTVHPWHAAPRLHSYCRVLLHCTATAPLTVLCCIYYVPYV